MHNSSAGSNFLPSVQKDYNTIHTFMGVNPSEIYSQKLGHRFAVTEHSHINANQLSIGVPVGPMLHPAAGETDTIMEASSR